LIAVCFCAGVSFAQQPGGAASRPTGFVLPEASPVAFDVTMKAEIDADAPIYPGLGRCRTFEFATTEEGVQSTIFVAAESPGAILSLRLEDPATGTVFVADERRPDAASLSLTTGKPRRFALVVADAAEGPSAPVLSVRRCVETEASLALFRALTSIEEKAAESVAKKENEATRGLLAEAARSVDAAKDPNSDVPSGHRWADVAHRLAGVAREIGANAEAVALLRPIRGVLAAYYPEWSPSRWKVDYDFGWALVKAGRPAEAPPALESAVRILEKRHPRDLTTPRVRSELARLLDSLGRRDRALELFGVSYRTFRDHPAADSAERRKATNIFAHASANVGRNADALKLYEESLQGSESRPASDPHDRIARIGRGDALRDLGRGAEAAVVFERELVAAERTSTSDADSLRFKLALSLTVAGFPSEALPHARAAAEALSARSPTSLDALNARFVLAVALGANGDAARALDEYDRLSAKAAEALPPHHVLRRNAAANAANEAAAVGDLAGALIRYETLLRSIAGKSEFAGTEALVRTNYAQRLRSSGRTEEALVEARKALDLFSAQPESTTAEQLFAARAGVATALMALGRHEDALAEYDRALAEGGAASARRTVDRMNRAICLQSLGRREEALVELRSVAKAEDARAALGAVDRTRAWLNVAAVAADLGRADESVAATTFVAEGAEAAAKDAPWRGARAGFDAASSMSDFVRRILRTHARGFGGDALLARAFDAASALRSAPFRAGALRRAAAKSPERRRVVEAVRAAQARVAATARDPAATPESVAKIVAERDRLLREATAALELPPQFAEASARPPAGSAFALVARTTRYLPQDLPDVRTEEVDRYEALVRTADGATRRVDLGLALELDDAAEAVHSDSEAVATAAERRLSSVVAALRAAAPGVDRIYATLDDGLQAAPLDASFPSSVKSGPELVVVASFDDVAASRPRLSDKDGVALAVVGGVDYGPTTNADSRSHGTFSPLPQSAAEARNVADLFATAFGDRAEVRSLVGAYAEADAATKAMVGAAYVHLATHGWFAPETQAGRTREEQTPGRVGELRVEAFDAAIRMAPLAMSGVAFAGANAYGPGRREGLASGEEFAAADLTTVDLFVLSACRSGTGLRRAGQCVQSLQTAIHLAGARTTIAAVARVDDAATRVLMGEFYSRLWINGATKLSAFREARAAVRDMIDPTTGRPKFRRRDWSAWVMSGAPD
jgi:CHAT domain-containing protein